MRLSRQRLLAMALVLACAAGGLFAARRAVLRAWGWTLVANDPVAPVDVIVIAVDAGGSGVLEAADLVRAGVARRVAVFADPPDLVDLELVRRGVPYKSSEFEVG